MTENAASRAMHDCQVDFLYPAEMTLVMDDEDIGDLGYKFRADISGTEIMIRGSILRWYLELKIPDNNKKLNNLAICGAVFDGKVNLNNISAAYNLFLLDCQFPDGITFEHAKINGINLSGSSVELFSISNASIHENIILDKIKAQSVNMSSTTVGGFIRADGCFIRSRYENTQRQGHAIDARGLSVGGFMSIAKSRIFGLCDFRELHCGSSVIFNECHLRGWRLRIDENRASLWLDHAKIGGSLSARDLRCAGSLVMRGASIARSLRLSGVISNTGRLGIDGGWIGVGHGVMIQNLLTDATLWLPLTSVKSQLNLIDLDFRQKRIKSTGNVGTKALEAQENEQAHSGSIVLSGSTCDVLNIRRLRAPKSRAVELWAASCRQLSVDLPTTECAFELLQFGYQGFNAPERENPAKTLVRFVESSGPGFSPDPYTRGAKVLSQMGFENDAAGLLVRCEQLRLRRGQIGLLGRFWGIIYGNLAGFGYRPQRAILGAIIAVALSTLVYHVNCNNFVPIKHWDASEQIQKINNRPSFNSFIFSIETFIPILNLHHAEYYSPNGACLVSLEAGSSSSLCALSLQTYCWIHVCVGWLFTTVLVAAATRMARRDIPK